MGLSQGWGPTGLVHKRRAGGRAASDPGTPPIARRWGTCQGNMQRHLIRMTHASATCSARLARWGTCQQSMQQARRAQPPRGSEPTRKLGPAPEHSLSSPAVWSSRRRSATTLAPSISNCRLMPLPTMPLAPAGHRRQWPRWAGNVRAAAGGVRSRPLLKAVRWSRSGHDDQGCKQQCGGRVTEGAGRQAAGAPPTTHRRPCSRFRTSTGSLLQAGDGVRVRVPILHLMGTLVMVQQHGGGAGVLRACGKACPAPPPPALPAPQCAAPQPTLSAPHACSSA